MKKVLVLLRGVSGSGKSTVAEMMSEGCYPILEADQYHYNKDGVYDWKKENMGQVHQWCQEQVQYFMSISMPKIIVSNTSTTEKELEPYLVMAEESGYSVISLIVEHRHSGKNIHNVPEHILDNQEKRLRNSLKLK